MTEWKNRNNYQVLKEVLLVMSADNVKTHIVYGSNTNFKMLKHYLETAKKSGLAMEIGNNWIVTDKGKEFILRVTELEAMLIEEVQRK